MKDKVPPLVVTVTRSAGSEDTLAVSDGEMVNMVLGRTDPLVQVGLIFTLVTSPYEPAMEVNSPIADCKLLAIAEVMRRSFIFLAYEKIG